MRVIVYAQDLSGRRDDGYFTKPDAASALDIFFDVGGVTAFLDAEGENPLNRKDAELILEQDRRVKFFNENGEEVIISIDPSV